MNNLPSLSERYTPPSHPAEAAHAERPASHPALKRLQLAFAFAASLTPLTAGATPHEHQDPVSWTARDETRLESLCEETPESTVRVRTVSPEVLAECHSLLVRRVQHSMQEIHTDHPSVEFVSHMNQPRRHHATGENHYHGLSAHASRGEVEAFIGSIGSGSLRVGYTISAYDLTTDPAHRSPDAVTRAVIGGDQSIQIEGRRYLRQTIDVQTAPQVEGATELQVDGDGRTPVDAFLSAMYLLSHLTPHETSRAITHHPGLHAGNSTLQFEQEQISRTVSGLRVVSFTQDAGGSHRWHIELSGRTLSEQTR